MMSGLTHLSDLTSFLLLVSEICAAGALIGCVLMLIQAASVLLFRGGQEPEHAAQPPVTILKPLHGSEPGLQDRLATFCRQDYDGPVQVLCGTQDSASPAVEAAGASMREPMVELNVDPQGHGTNRKVSNLINMLPHARHDTLVLSDADIVVEPDYLRSVTALLSAPRVGVVTCLYHGIASGGLWSRLSALAINTHFLPQAITALSFGLAKPCSGATIALRRSTLDSIGGFVAFADALADDYAIGEAASAVGYEVVTAPFVVGHRCFEGSLRQLMQHEIRVARTIKSIDAAGYAGTIFTHPLPLALLSLLSGTMIAPLLLLTVLAARVAVCRCVERRFGLPRQDYWLIPLHDLVAFAVYIASFFGATVHWRGSDYRVATNGKLIET